MVMVKVVMVEVVMVCVCLILSLPPLKPVKKIYCSWADHIFFLILNLLHNKSVNKTCHT